MERHFSLLLSDSDSQRAREILERPLQSVSSDVPTLPVKQGGPRWIWIAGAIALLLCTAAALGYACRRPSALGSPEKSADLAPAGTSSQAPPPPVPAGCPSRGSAHPGLLSLREEAIRHPGPTYGVDASHYDGTIDWARARDAGVRFAFIKATDGTQFEDPCFRSSWGALRSARVSRGAYHFFRPDHDAAEQAHRFLNVIGTLEADDLPPVLDVEHTPGIEEIPTPVLLSRIKQWLTTVERATRRAPIVYTSARFWRGYLSGSRDMSHYPLWIADYHSQTAPLLPQGWSSWTFWQFSNTGLVEGTFGRVDLSRFNGSEAELRRLAAPVAEPDAGPALPQRENLRDTLRSALEQGSRDIGRGYWITTDVRISNGSEERLDLAAWTRRDHKGRIARESAPQWGALILMDEAASRAVKTRTLARLRRRGVRYLWLLHARERTLEGYRAHRQGWLRLGGWAPTERPRVLPFHEFRVPLAQIFPTPP